MQKEAKSVQFLIRKCTNSVLIKLKNLTERYSVRFGVSRGDRISNALLQTLDELSALYQLVTGKLTF